MEISSWFRRLPAILFCTLSLVGCSSLGMSYTDVKCPSTDITGELGTVSRFRGEGGNFADLAYHAQLTDAKGNCSLDDEGATIDMKVTILAELGPAASERTVQFPYFVAIVGPNNRVLAKRVFDDTLTFAPNQRRAGATDSFTQRIPLRDPHDAPDYHVFVGFQLTNDELAYNRSHGGL
ncbi:MAG TPA: hypothetical protein VKS60_16755 [Stellaceae bacterium]|nr:hypothetical protein [Stellaceae bacterium]